MTGLITATHPDAAPVSLIRSWNLIWVGLALAVMVAAILDGGLWFLNFVHVLAGVLWTGIDLFMGFVMGPIIRCVDIDSRRAIITRLMPKMLFLMPTVSIVTTTAGWFLAERRGYFDLPYPEFWWIVTALVIVTVLTIQGLGILLPTNLRVLFQFQKPQPDMALIGGWMRTYVWVIASQATLQVAIIVVMARIATGL